MSIAIGIRTPLNPIVGINNRIPNTIPITRVVYLKHCFEKCKIEDIVCSLLKTVPAVTAKAET